MGNVVSYIECPRPLTAYIYMDVLVMILSLSQHCSSGRQTRRWQDGALHQNWSSATLGLVSAAAMFSVGNQ